MLDVSPVTVNPASRHLAVSASKSKATHRGAFSTHSSAQSSSDFNTLGRLRDKNTAASIDRCCRAGIVNSKIAPSGHGGFTYVVDVDDVLVVVELEVLVLEVLLELVELEEEVEVNVDDELDVEDEVNVEVDEDVLAVVEVVVLVVVEVVVLVVLQPSLNA